MQNDIPVVHVRTFTQDEQKAFQEMKDLLKRLNSAPSIDVEVPSVLGTDGYILHPHKLKEPTEK